MRKLVLVGVIAAMITACGNNKTEILENEDLRTNGDYIENTSDSDDLSDEIENASDTYSTEEDIETEEQDSVLSTVSNIKIVNLKTNDNDFLNSICEPVKEGCSRASFSVDLDKDGVEEAFVIEGYESTPGTPDYDDSYEYWYVNNIWFVDEKLNASALEEYEGSHISTSQEILECDSKNFISINGYIGIDGIGCVYSVTEDSIKNCTPELSKAGQKKFADDNQLVWFAEDYRAYYEIMEGCKISESLGLGRCHMPYHMYMNGDEFELYGAKEISLDEVKKIASIEFDDEIDLSTAQFILRDNNELDVNYYTKDEIDYAFNCCIYFLNEDKLTWDLSETIHGYMDVLLNDNSWDVLYEEM